MDTVGTQFIIGSDILDLSQWIVALLAFLVSLLTLYNALRLKTGILAVSTYAFGGGMLCLSAAFFLQVLPAWQVSVMARTIQTILLIVGFLLLGFGSFKIFKMSDMT